jgi:Clp amino terminal domain, pathogenicity island component/UvrB/uvrC motif
MFERFTERARLVIVFGQEDARTLKHQYIGTEHILMGLLREEEGLAARTLESLGITIERVRGQVERVVGAGTKASPKQIPFTPPAKHALELALREALLLEHRYVGTEHLLLALMHAEEGAAVSIVRDLGAAPALVRERVLGDLLSNKARRQVEVEPVPAGLEHLKMRIEVLERDKEAAIEAHEFERAALLRDRERRLINTRQAMERQEREGQAKELKSLIEQIRYELELAIAAREFERAGHLGARQRRLAALVSELEDPELRDEAPAGKAAPLVVRELNYELGNTRRAKEAAIEALEFELAANLSDREGSLLGLKERLEQLESEIATTQDDLELAIAASDFDKAAALRDRIRALERQQQDLQERWWDTGETAVEPAPAHQAAGTATAVADADAAPAAAAVATGTPVATVTPDTPVTATTTTPAAAAAAPGTATSATTAAGPTDDGVEIAVERVMATIESLGR